MARWHLRAARAAGARPTVFVDINPSARERLARQAPGVATSACLGDWARQVDVAHVCTPVETHSALVGELLGSGVNVFVEKPLARTAEEVRALTSRAEQGGVLLCPTHQYAFQSGLRWAMAELPRMGRLRRIDFDICSAGAVGPFAGRFMDVIGEILPHPLSILQAVLPASHIGDVDWSVRSGDSGREILATAHVDEVLVSLFISNSARPTCFRTRLQADLGSLEVDGFQGGCIRLPERSSRAAKLLSAYERAGRMAMGATRTLSERVIHGETAYPGLRELVRRFYAALNGGAPPITMAQMVEAATARDNLLGARREVAGEGAA